MRFECGPEWDTRIINIEPKGKIGILMSGGIDSWVLYNLLKLTPNCPPITIFIIMASGDGGEGFDTPARISLLTDRDDIIEIDKFIECTENDSPNFKPWGEVIAMSIVYILEKYGLDELYNGTNMTPPIEHFPEFNTDEIPIRPWKISDLLPWAKLKCPLLHLYKYHIIDLANQHNINIKNTHSCNVDPYGDCGKCWWCLEKQWGYKQLEGEA